MHKFVAVACGAVWTITAPPVAAEPLVRMHTNYYYIDGRSATVLAAQIDRNGPHGADGIRFAGKTKWDVQWKFRHKQHGVTCGMKEVAVVVGIAQTLPRWRGESKGAAALKTTRITKLPPPRKSKPCCSPQSRLATARILALRRTPRPRPS